MADNTVANQFLAAVGIGSLVDRVATSHLQSFYLNALTEYRKEVQYERARLMRQNPMDYRAVRKLDRELDDVSDRLREVAAENTFTE